MRSLKRQDARSAASFGSYDLAMDQRPPVLIHIGYHRTASSWLQRYYFGDPRTGLRWLGKQAEDHPVRQIIRTRWSEFDPRTLRAQFDPLLREAQAEGLVPVVSFERLSGHACSGGYDSEQIAQRLAQVFPEGRVLIVIREQRAAILSNYKRYIKAGGPGTLREFLLPPATKNARVPLFDFRHFEYHHLLGRYHALFGADAVLILAFEQFVREPAAFVSHIGHFVGRPVEQDVLDSLPFKRRAQKTFSSVTQQAVLRRLNVLVRSEVNPTPFFDLHRHKELRRLARAAPEAALPPEVVAAETDEALAKVLAELVGDRYAASNRATAELTGIDLAAYGWRI
jgi:hypothetical protein